MGKLDWLRLERRLRKVLRSTTTDNALTQVVKLDTILADETGRGTSIPDGNRERLAEPYLSEIEDNEWGHAEQENQS